MKKKVKVLLIFVVIVLLVILGLSLVDKKEEEKTYKGYLASSDVKVSLYDLEYNKADDIYRGENVIVYENIIKENEEEYRKIEYKNNVYLVKNLNVVKTKEEIIKEKELYVRTNVTLYKDTSSKILSHIKKGEKLDITGYDKIDSQGVVNRYKVKYNDYEGYVYSKYLVKTKEESLKVYDENNLQAYMKTMGDSLGGGNASTLDYYPYSKPSFDNNKMPDEVRSLYLNSEAVKNIDNYIDFAVNNNINALVIDIKDNTVPAYNSPIMKEYSNTNYINAVNEFEDYKKYILKAKEAGLYLIGRITTFKDSYYVNDHKESAITNNNGDPFKHNGSYWPSAYNRGVWEFNVELGKEAIVELGFNEIQFDYVRFPDRTTTLERNGVINLHNTYNESKAEALQNFVMYACDEIHSVGGYVSIDVFGESASNYVTAYGQFWSAISNIADVISGMPYPDHFNPHEYGIKEVVWTVPYKLLNEWSKSVVSKQNIIPTPAIVRTWIQTYNATKEPYVVYDSSKMIEQIEALYDNGLTGGYMTWNSGSNLYKYKEVSYAFKKVY